MPITIASGWLAGFVLFDVAESIDLAHVGKLVASSRPARAGPKAPEPAYLQYANPPVAIEGHAVGVRLEQWDVRFRVFDYGVISMSLTQAMPGSWDEILGESARWQEDPGLLTAAEEHCRTLLAQIQPALTRPSSRFVSEDYLALVATSVAGVDNAEALLTSHGDEIARLLRGEREALSPQERDDVLRQRLSYLASDLVVPTWSTAFVYDTPAGAGSVLEILEFANSQLLQFRYYDGLLDRELSRIYADLQTPARMRSWFGRRFTRAARQLHSLFIDVNELTDRTKNALKVAGDVYTARLLTLVNTRLGLEHWKGNVREKLKTLDDIYRFTVEQTSMARGEMLELVIVLILLFELVLFFAGIMT